MQGSQLHCHISTRVRVEYEIVSIGGMVCALIAMIAVILLCEAYAIALMRSQCSILCGHRAASPLRYRLNCCCIYQLWSTALTSALSSWVSGPDSGNVPKKPSKKSYNSCSVNPDRSQPCGGSCSMWATAWCGLHCVRFARCVILLLYYRCIAVNHKLPWLTVRPLHTHPGGRLNK